MGGTTAQGDKSRNLIKDSIQFKQLGRISTCEDRENFPFPPSPSTPPSKTSSLYFSLLIHTYTSQKLRKKAKPLIAIGVLGGRICTSGCLLLTIFTPQEFHPREPKSSWFDPSLNMVQRKAPRRAGMEAKVSEKRLACQQQQDKRSSVRGGAGGEDDLSKKTKKPSPTARTSGGLPNYMKPTSTSGAKKDRLQVTINSPDINKSPKNRNNDVSKQSSLFDAKPSRSLTRNNSLKPVRSSMKKSSGMGHYPKTNMSKPTCSSTLKDSKFPKELELDVSEETSILKVCPYTYCSLNGHKHEPLPSLKCFVSARRQMVKRQKSMKLKRLSSLIAISRMPSGLDLNCLSEDVGGNFFVEIYDKPKTEMVQFNNSSDADIQKIIDEVYTRQDDLKRTMNHKYTPSFDIKFEGDLDLTDDFTDEEMELLKEYAAWDSDSYIANILDNDSEGQVDSETSLRASYEANNMRWEKDEGIYLLSKTDDSDGVVNPIINPVLEIADAGHIWSFEPDDYSFPSENVTVNGDETPVITILDYGSYEENKKEENDNWGSISEVQISDSSQGYIATADNTEEFDCMEVETEAFKKETRENEEIISNSLKEHYTELDVTMQIQVGFNPNAQEDESLDTPTVTSGQHLVEASTELKARYKTVRVRREEDVQEIRDFNPRPPRFLPIEDDPEAEKVRLRNQLMDERKNAEEWMIDYALQQVVTKLAPARKRKVELLVQAFETIMPLPNYETPRKDISGFTQARSMQACS